MAELNEQDPITGRKLPRLANYNGQDQIDPTKPALPRIRRNTYVPGVQLVDYTRSGYDNPETYVEDLPRLGAIRAENQGFGSTLMNGLGRAAVNIIPTVVGNVASMLDFEDYVNQDNEVGNAVTRAMEEFKTNVDEALPIYRENQNQSFDIGDSAWWIDNGSSLVESIAAFAITGAGLGAALNIAGKGLGTINALANLGEAGKVAATVLSATGLNQAESITTAMQVYDTTYKTAIENGQDDARAKQNAADAAAYSININRANIALNLTSAGAFIRNPNLTRQIRHAFTGQGAKEVLHEGLQEYAEETLNYVAQKEGERMGDTVAKGKQYQFDFNRALSDAFSAQGIESGVLGFIGGAGQTGLTRVVNRMNGRAAQQDAAYQSQQESIARIQGLQDAGIVPNVTNVFDSASRNIDLQNQIQQAADEGNDAKVKELQYQLFNTQLNDALDNGTVDKLESVYTDLLNLTSEEAANKGLDVEPNSPYYYKKKANEALELITDVEESYLKIANKGYVNPNEVMQSYIQGKTLNRLLTEQMSDYNKSQTQALQDKLNLGIQADLNSTNPPAELTNLDSYKQYVIDRTLVENTRNRLIKNNEDYNNLISNDTQNKLKEEARAKLQDGLEKARKEVKKQEDADVKNRQKEVKKKVDKNKQDLSNQDLIAGRKRFDFDTRTGNDILKEYNIKDNKVSQKDALNNIIKSKYSNDLEKEISRKLLSKTTDKDIILSDDNLEEGPGFYESTSGIVTINFKRHGGDFGVDNSLENIIVHELVHKYTVEEYEKGGKFTRQINDLYEAITNSGTVNNFYGATHPAEMITEGMLSPEFQQALANIKYKNTSKTAWDRFLDIVSGLLSSLGIKTNNTALEQLIGLTTNQIDSVNTNAAEEADTFNDVPLPTEENVPTDIPELDTFVDEEVINTPEIELLDELEVTSDEYTGITPEEQATADIVVQEEVNDAEKELKNDGLVRTNTDLTRTSNYVDTTRQRTVGNTIISLNVDYVETVLGNVDDKTNERRIFDTYDDEGLLIINENFDSRLQSPNQFKPGDDVRIIVPTFDQMRESGVTGYTESDYNIADTDIDSFVIAFIDSSNKIIGYLPTRSNINKRVDPTYREAALINNRKLRETLYNNRDKEYTVKITRKSVGSLLTNKVNRDLYNALGDGTRLADDVELAIYKDSRLQTSISSNSNKSIINKPDLNSGFLYAVIPTAETGSYLATPMNINTIGEEGAESVLRMIQLYKASDRLARDKALVNERNELAREIDFANTTDFNNAVSSVMYTSTTDDAYMFKMGKNKLSLGVTPDMNFAWDDVMSDQATQTRIKEILAKRYHAVQLSNFGQRFNYYALDADNKLAQERYNNYFDFLDQRGVVSTNVQGYPVANTNNERYFTGQSVIEFSNPIITGTNDNIQEAEEVTPDQIEAPVEDQGEPGEAAIPKKKSTNKLGIKYKPKNTPSVTEDINSIIEISNIKGIDAQAEALMKKCGG